MVLRRTEARLENACTSVSMSSEFHESCDRDNQPRSRGRIMEESVLVVDWPWTVVGVVVVVTPE